MDPLPRFPLPRKLIRAAAVSLLAAAMAGCAGSLNMQVNSEVPTPVIQKVPLTVGVYYDPKFRAYAYKENSKDRPNWDIESGASQVALFNKILPSMFNKVVQVDGIHSAGVDGIIEPSVVDMQFAMPQETRSELYEAWIKYSIKLYSPSGQLLTEWPLTAYGKSTDKFLKSRQDGLSAAMTMALRDAGAKLALQFDKAADVRQWIASATVNCSANAGTC